MSKPAFTPGPWRHEGQGDIVGIENFKCFDVCSVYLRSIPGRSEANAALISAAPELFEALQMLCGDDPIQSFCVHDTERHANGRAKGTWGLAAMNKARAALDKATGATK